MQVHLVKKSWCRSALTFEKREWMKEKRPSAFFLLAALFSASIKLSRLITKSRISRSRCWILAILAHFWTVISRSSTDQKGGSRV